MIVKRIHCPECDALLTARTADPWEIIRAVAAVHLRRCPKSSHDRRKIGTMAIQIADEAVYGSHDPKR